MSIEALLDKEQSNEAPAISNEQLSAIAALAKQQVEYEAAIAAAEEELKLLKKNHLHLSRFQLPEMMAGVGMSSFSLEDGTKVEVTDHLQASIAKKNEAAAFRWLEEHGHGSIIKNVLTISIPVEDHERVAGAIDLLKEHGFEEVERKTSVHANTLKAWARAQQENDEEIDEELFGVFNVTVAKVTLPKTK